MLDITNSLSEDGQGTSGSGSSSRPHWSMQLILGPVEASPVRPASASSVTAENSVSAVSTKKRRKKGRCAASAPSRSIEWKRLKFFHTLSLSTGETRRNTFLRACLIWTEKAYDSFFEAEDPADLKTQITFIFHVLHRCQI